MKSEESDIRGNCPILRPPSIWRATGQSRTRVVRARRCAQMCSRRAPVMQEQEVILKRRMSLQLVSIVALLGAVLIPASGVNASGYENIGGFAPTSQTNWYTTI